MTDDKTKVKDLAVELGVPTKDLLRVLRDLDIIAKSTMSAITADDLARVRARFQGSTQEKTDDRREIQPGVIVRRRRQVAVESVEADEPEAEVQVAAKAEPAPRVNQARVVDTPPAKIIEPARIVEPAHIPEPVARIIEPARNTEPVARIIEPARNTEPVARIIEPAKASTLPAPEQTAGSEPVPTVTPVVAAVMPAAPVETSEPTLETPAPIKPAPEASKNESEDPVQEKPKTDKNRSNKNKKRGLREAAPVARVISRPQDLIAAKEAAEAKAAKEAAEAKEAQLKEAQAKEAEAKEQKVDDKQRKPQASAKPEGSSAISLLPPINEGPVDEEEKERRRKRRPEPVAPQVRIISRPDLQAQQQERIEKAERQAAAAAAPRDPRAPGVRPAPRSPQDRDNRDNRPQQDRRPYTPGGARPAPNPAFDGRDKDSTRPAKPVARPATPAKTFPPAGPLGGLEREGQSKKKRNKNKRPGEFQQVDASVGKRRDDDDDMPRFRSAKRRPKVRQPVQSTQPLKAAKRKIRIEESIRVSDMAHQMGLKANEIIKVLFNLGIMATINKSLDIETATIVAAEFDYEVEKVGFAEEDYISNTADKSIDNPSLMKLRPPVVTIMGHVDHGKTSLLDAIRKTNVTGGEAGGITQHIGAYHVSTKRGEIVFLDTPGHEAFTAMRARGAQVTDLVVLVVAADDGVMEQTREAVSHAKAAKVPIMVAVNKMDKPEANPDRVLRELSEIGLVPEDWGGDTVISKVSAKTREGLDDLLELLALQADILELKANPDKPARGHIVEAKLDKGRGPVATVLIQEGTLHQGDTFVCGVFSGKVRAMFNDQGRKVKDAGPSMPVEVQGFDGVPEAGEEFICLADEKLARRIADSRAIKQRERELAKESKVTLETFLSRSPDSQEALTLNLVVKSDVQGSLEAILEAVRKLSTDKVRINIIHGGTGAITESDIILASASDAIVIGFNVRPTAKVKDVAEHENVDIRFYDIIYKLVDEIKSAMAGLLAPVSREVYLGQAEVREVFSVPKVGTIAGSHVSDGKLMRNAGVRILRNGIVVHTGKISSLRRFKDDVKEVQKGYECGISLENFNDIKIADIIEAFETAFEAATL